MKTALFSGRPPQGLAPFSYLDKSGELQGIFRQVLERISEVSGLKFKYQVFSSIQDYENTNESEVVFIISNYASEDLMLSQPFFESEAVLYMNSNSTRAS